MCVTAIKGGGGCCNLGLLKGLEGAVKCCVMTGKVAFRGSAEG